MLTCHPVLPSKDVVMCLSMEVRVLDRLPAGMNCSAIGHEVNVKKLTIWYIQKKKKEIHPPVHEAAG